MPIAMTFITSEAYGEVEQRGQLSKLAKWQRLELNATFNHLISHINTIIDIHLWVNSFSRWVGQSVSQSDSQPVPCYRDGHILYD